MINLINEKKVSFDEVIKSLNKQKSDTSWAEKTNDFAINYAQHLTEVYGDVWYSGFLPLEYFLNILLPKHVHHISNENTDDILQFPEDTTVKDATNLIKSPKSIYANDCLKSIDYLKEKILETGFISNIVLVVIDGKIKHVDGLHRMIALALLFEDGYKYKPIEVFLCRG